MDPARLRACLRVLAITDGRGDAARIEEQVTLAFAGGVRAFQLREPDLSDGALTALCERLIARVRPGGGLVLVNARIGVARAAGADGVHLRADGPAVAAARQELGAGRVVGASIHSAAEAAARADADYLVLAPVLPTRSKPGAPGLGFEAARRLGAACTPPVLWLGGFDPTSIRTAGGAIVPAGFASRSAWSEPADQIVASCAAIVAAVDAILGPR